MTERDTHYAGAVYTCQGPPKCDFDGENPETVMPCPFCRKIYVDSDGNCRVEEPTET